MNGVKSDNKKFTVMSVEDDDDYFMLLQSILKNTFQIEQVVRAADGEEFVNYFLSCKKNEGSGTPDWPDLVLLDLNLPKKSGHEALEEIRNNPDFPHVPIIVLTVSSDQQDIDKSYRLGADLFISKPTGMKELVEILEKALTVWHK